MVLPRALLFVSILVLAACGSPDSSDAGAGGGGAIPATGGGRGSTGGGTGTTGGGSSATGGGSAGTGGGTAATGGGASATGGGVAGTGGGMGSTGGGASATGGGVAGTGGGTGATGGGTAGTGGGVAGTGGGTGATGGGTTSTGGGTSGTGGGTQGSGGGTSGTGGGTAGLPSTTAKAISGGRLHSCAVTTAGTVRCWGSNDYGQLGTGAFSTGFVLTPVQVTSLTGVTGISGWADFTCAVAGGAAKCWGDGSHGQLGNNTLKNSASPVDVTGLGSGVATVSAGWTHACALTTGGGVKCWGANNSGQLGNDTNDDSKVPVDVVGLGSGVKAISAGWDGTCAVTTAGAVKCWGAQYDGRLGNTSVSATTLVPVDVTGITSGATFVATAEYHTCVVTAAGVSCMGTDQHGEIGDGLGGISAAQVDEAKAISGVGAGAKGLALGVSHSCAITSGGGVRCWGSAIGSFADDLLVPTAVPGLANVSALASGTDHVCALTQAGAVLCWGTNDGNELGNGETTDSPTPVPVLTLP